MTQGTFSASENDCRSHDDVTQAERAVLLGEDSKGGNFRHPPSSTCPQWADEERIIGWERFIVFQRTTGPEHTDVCNMTWYLRSLLLFQWWLSEMSATVIRYVLLRLPCWRLMFFFFMVEIDRLVVCLLDWLIESTGQLQTQPVKRGATSERENRNWRKMQVRVHQVKTSLLP